MVQILEPFKLKNSMNPKSSNSSDPKIVRILGAEQEMRGWKKLS
jgi:hypothetical protein